MVEVTPGDVAMLGLDGVRVLAVGEVDGELEVTIETTDTRVGCRGCGVIASAHARREVAQQKHRTRSLAMISSR